MMFNIIFKILSKSFKRVLSFGTTFRFKSMVYGSTMRAKVIYPASLNICGKLVVGKDFFCGPGLYFSSNQYSVVEIGSAVMFGPFVRVLSGNHILNNNKSHMRYIQDDDVETKKIVIEDGVWIGAGVTILSGAYISEGAVIGANSTVSGYIPPFCIAAGHPAKMIKRRFTDEELKLMLASILSKYSFQEVKNTYKNYEGGPKK